MKRSNKSQPFEGISSKVSEQNGRPMSQLCSKQAVRTRIALGVADEVAAIKKLTATALIALGRNGVKSLDDLADLARDELIEIVGRNALTEEVADEIIMAARAHWFEESISKSQG